MTLLCPHCNYKFRRLAVAGGAYVPDLAPVLCESCCCVSILETGKARKATPAEEKAIKESPAWRDILEPVQRELLKHKRSTN